MDTIDTFLANWKDANFNFYVDVLDDYYYLTKLKLDLMEKYGLQTFRYGQVLPNDYVAATKAIEDFINSHTKATISIIMEAKRTYKSDGGRIFNKILDREVKAKKEKLIARIEKKAGKIVDTHGLYLGLDGNLNGVVCGERHTVSVRTILAGGYIQCLHYRVLVK